MPTFFIEEHAADQYRDRVRKCSFNEAVAYLIQNAPLGSWMKEKARGRNGGMQIRLPDCVLIVKDYSHSKKYDYAVVTVLGPNEIDERFVDTDDEMSMLNAMADASARFQPVFPASVATLKEKVFSVPASLAEGKKRKHDLLADLVELRLTAKQAPNAFAYQDANRMMRDVEAELTHLNAWLKEENKRIAAELKAKADEKKQGSRG